MTAVGPDGLANLGMYPFDELHWAFDRFWEAVHDRVDWVPPRLDRAVDLHESWERPDLVVGQTCGWPLVTTLRDRVRVIGAFTAATPQGEGYSYRSVLVAGSAGRPADFAGGVAAVNNEDSLSGRISLFAAFQAPGGQWQGDVVLTGAHVDSVRAIAAGRADIAAIDSVTWWQISRLMPDLVRDLFVIGTGPLIPCLPVITSAATTDEQLDQLRSAMVDAVHDPLVEPAARAMCTTGFVPLGLEHYLPVLGLVPAGT